MTAEISVYNIQQGRSRIDKITEKLTSNQMINRPSDDPVSSGTLLDVKSKITLYDQFNVNITKCKSWLEVTNNGLTGMSDILDAARNLISGSSSLSIQDPTQRQVMNDQLVEIKKQLIEMGNVQYGDQYIFGGGNNLVPPFNTTDNTYAGDSNQRKVEITTNTLQAFSTTGDRLLLGGGTDPNYGSTNILQVMDDLIAAVGDFTTTGDSAAVTAAGKQLEAAAKQVNAAITINSSRILRVDNMAKLNDINKTTLTTIATSIQNVDLAKYGMQLNAEQTAFQASLAATARISSMSLLDYIY